MCGYFSVSFTLMSVNLMFRYWSTECNVPHMLYDTNTGKEINGITNVLHKLKAPATIGGPQKLS